MKHSLQNKTPVMGKTSLKHCSAPRLWCDVTFSLLCIGSGDLLGFCVLSVACQNFLSWQTWCWTGNLQVWRWDESCEAILTSQMSSILLEEGMIPASSQALSGQEENTTWYLLFAHANNNPLKVCSNNCGRGMRVYSTEVCFKALIWLLGFKFLRLD